MKIGQPELSEEKSEAPRPQGGASRRGSFLHIVPLDPTYKAGLAGHVPAKEVGGLFHLQKDGISLSLRLTISVAKRV